MSLLEPNLGDRYDRMTILARKIVERPDRADFKGEFDALNEDTPVRPAALLILAALNAAIWQREDRLRELAAGKLIGDTAYCDVEAIATVALAIQNLNDRRAALIAELNGTPSEKLYERGATERAGTTKDPIEGD